MKSFSITCFVLMLVLSLALADVSELESKKSVDSSKAADKSSDSKPKRDASFLIGSGYHGPSYKYLPPSSASSVYDSHGGAHHGLGGSYVSSGLLGGAHSSGHHHAHHAGHGYAGHSLGHLSGLSGHSGHSGLSGLSSHSGHSGHSGLSGLSSHSGHSGLSSHSGLSGHSGHSSHSGLSAHSGYAGHSAHSGLKLSGTSHGSALPAYAGGHSYTSALGAHGYATGASSLGGHHHSHSSGHGLSSGHGSLGPVFTAGHGVLSSGPSYTSSHASPSATAGLLHGGHGGHGGHSYITSASLGGAGSLGHKVLSSHSNVPSYSLSAGQVGAAAGLASGYHYAKGLSGSLPSSLHSAAGSSHLGSSAGIGVAAGLSHLSHLSHLGHLAGIGSYANHGFASSGLAGSDLHHSDHVHNGNQEHHYVVSTAHDANDAGHAASHGLSSGDGYHYENPSNAYLAPSSQQHQVQPSNSYGVPLSSVGTSYSSSYNGQASADDSPNYAAGHKGLGHFSYTASKPNVLHTSFVDSGFKTPNYSNAPFKPSTFLGSKYESSSYTGESAALGHSPSQQYLPPSGVGADSNGYDYPAPTGGALVYRDSGAGHSDNATPIYEPESTYLPPHPVESSYNDAASNQSPSANYLPPNGQQTYGTPH